MNSSTPLLEFCEAYAAARKLAPKTAALLERLCRRVTVILARSPIVADLRRDVFDQLKGELWRNYFVALWRFAADSAIVPLDADLRRHERSGRPAKREWPPGELAAFVGGLLRPRDPAERKLRLLLAHLADAFSRAPLLSDLNAIALAALVNHLRGKRKLSTAFVADCRKRFRFVWREAAAQGLAGDVPRTVRGKAGRKSARRLPLTVALQRRITTAVAMRAAGDDWETIARHFKLTPEAIFGWRKRHALYWKAELDRAMAAESERLRQLAGSRAAIDEVDFARQVERVEQWARGRGESLFPTQPAEAIAADPTRQSLSQFCRDYLIPVCLRPKDASKQTIRLYEVVCKKFDLLMGQPAIGQISNATLAAFVALLKSLPARGKRGAKLSLQTTVMYAENVMAVLRAAGPPDRRHPDSAGILQVSPFIRVPRVELKEPRIVSDAAFQAVFDAAERATRPSEQAPEFWRCLLVLARYLALRSRTLFELRWDNVDLVLGRIVIEPAQLKSRRGMVLPIPPIVRKHLEPLKREAGLVLNWPHSLEWFRGCFRNLQVASGLAADELFGLHDLRRSSLTALWHTAPQAAQILGGHASIQTTIRHYINQEAILRAALSA